MSYQVIESTDKAIGAFLEFFKSEVIANFFEDQFSREEAEFALTEILNNAHEHGNKKDSKKKIIIVWEFVHQFLIVSVKDEGFSFEKKSIALPPLNCTRGRGLFSVQECEVVETLSLNQKDSTVTIFFKKKEDTK